MPKSGPIGEEYDPKTWDGNILVDALETLKPDTCLRALGRRKWPVSLLPPGLRMAQTTRLSHDLPHHHFGTTSPSQGRPLGCDQGARWQSWMRENLSMQKHFPTRQHVQRDVGLICLWVGIWTLKKVVACTMWNSNAKIA